MPTAAPPTTVVPPFVLPDRNGNPFNTAQLRGRRYAILLFLSPDDTDAAAYLQSFAARREELAWLHTEVIVVVPEGATVERLPALPFPVLRDDGQVRARVLPAIAPEVMALLVTDLSGEVAAWRTARRVASLPDIEAAIEWAWEVARPKGSCGGVTWAPTANPPPPAPPPAPIGRFTIGAHRRSGYHRGGSGFGVRGSKN
jgi:peroxiredoxin